MTYFRMGNPHYHRRGVVSLSCSGWEGVGPTRYGRQTNWCQGSGIRDQECPEAQRLPDAFGRSKKVLIVSICDSERNLIPDS